MNETTAPSASPPPGELRSVLEEKRAELLSRIEQFGASPTEMSNLNFGKRSATGPRTPWNG